MVIFDHWVLEMDLKIVSENWSLTRMKVTPFFLAQHPSLGRPMWWFEC